MTDLQRAARVGIWFTLAAIALVFLFAACASAPPAPTRQLPPPGAWPFCAEQCAAYRMPFLGVIAIDPQGHQFGCGCGEAMAVPVPQAFRGPT